ncbi:hypothetical protein F5Y15DRAFT_403345 [Xylariaceae sp. FL0016]|nr:hypothetical protein F5Y15DRAFT_403345 [Xylariaceae sp. FL0016]
MHRALSSRWLNSALNITEQSSRVELPLFLCPSARSISCLPRTSSVATHRLRPSTWSAPRRCLHMQADNSSTTVTIDPAVHKAVPVHKLPRQCTGCGALSQVAHPSQPGYFDLKRKAVKSYIGAEEDADISRREDEIFKNALGAINKEDLEKQGVDVQSLVLGLGSVDTVQQPAKKKPLCDRCHYLLHNHTGQSIFHPDVDSIRDTIMESPYKYNHVYHVLDAADFPMSILPRISKLLDLMPLRSQNRRAKDGRFYHGQKTEVSFVITRSDLLAPTKQQVDTLHPYLQEVLRDALGRTGKNVRLGNLRTVSAKRSWWTKELKEDIWKRGGAGWMVGKVNVGKSQLFEAVFPKGRMEWAPTKHQISVDLKASPRSGPVEEALTTVTPPGIQNDSRVSDFGTVTGEEALDDYSLLPPAPQETQYPEMPLVSDLPGTTASPIRVPFGNGRGELIDLPGLERTALEYHVKDEHRLSLIMKNRIVPEQMTIKPGQSLLLGGMIRITPREPAPIMLSYAFTPIEPHVSRTDKAIGIQNQTGEVNIENIAKPGTGEQTKLAGSFELKWDVTKQRTGPLMRKAAVGLRLERLPYRVLSTDILIEGVGWVEIAAQVRTRDLFAPKPDAGAVSVETRSEEGLSALERLEALEAEPKRKTPVPMGEKADVEPNWPIVDVYSPEGKFISNRRPMNGWILNKPRFAAAASGRPRKSMKGMKKLEKKRRREGDATTAHH